VRFSLVLLDSCESGMSTWDEFLAVPHSVDVVAHSGFGTTFPGQIDYEKLVSLDFANERGRSSLTNDFLKLLNRYGFWTNRIFTLWAWPFSVTAASIPSIFYFTPMVIWLLTGSTARSRLRTVLARNPLIWQTHTGVDCNSGGHLPRSDGPAPVDLAALGSTRQGSKVVATAEPNSV
jgi:hypothetical protein